MKFRLRRVFGLYEPCPRWYAFAYFDHVYGRGIAYPIGIHWIAMVCHRLWEFSLKWPRPSRIECELARAYSAGFEAGRTLHDEVPTED